MKIVPIPMERLSPEALKGLIEELVTRDGTDYGAREHTLEEKVRAVVRQLERGELAIVFDLDSQRCDIIPRDGALQRP